MRGGFQYKRPYGWKRIAIKVLENMGIIPGLAATGYEQKKPRGPVSYHGTNMKGTQLILKEGINPDQKRYLVDAFTLVPTWK